MSNCRVERCACGAVIPVNSGFLQKVVGQTPIYICRPCTLTYITSLTKQTEKGETEDEPPDP